MKKFLTVLALITVLAVSLATAKVSFAESSAPVEALDFLQQFIDSRSNGGESAFLTDKFNQIENLEVSTVQLQDYDGVAPHNILGKKASYVKTNSQVIIGAHYDTVLNSQGANDNASGITALYLIMQQLQNVDLPFNVVYVAFCCEEDGMLGSQHFVNSFDDYKTFGSIDDTIVMFNLDSIANGDNLYVGCESVSTPLADFVVNSSDGAMTEKPHAIGTNYGEGLLGYSDITTNADYVCFRSVGIPTVNIFSGNFDVVTWSYYERKDGNSTMNTTADTLANLQRDGEYLNKINAVANTVVATLTNDEFLPMANCARSNLVNLKLWYNPLYPLIVMALALIVIVILAIRYHKRLQKDSLLNPAEAKQTDTFFGAPSATDIFSFGNDSTSSSDNADDIFSYKD